MVGTRRARDTWRCALGQPPKGSCMNPKTCFKGSSVPPQVKARLLCCPLTGRENKEEATPHLQLGCHLASEKDVTVSEKTV